MQSFVTRGPNESATLGVNLDVHSIVSRGVSAKSFGDVPHSHVFLSVLLEVPSKAREVRSVLHESLRELVPTEVVRGLQYRHILTSRGTKAVVLNR